MPSKSVEADFSFTQKARSWVQDNIETLSRLHTDAMKKYWNENWSNDLSGKNTRCFSPALIESYLQRDAVFFSAEDEKQQIAGYAILLPISETYLEKHGKNREWANTDYWSDHNGVTLVEAEKYKPKAGDMELALTITNDSYKGRGIFKRLAALRLQYACNSLNVNDRIWLQTLQKPEIGIVEQFYLGNGFELIAKVKVKQTERIILSKKI